MDYKLTSMQHAARYIAYLRVDVKEYDISMLTSYKDYFKAYRPNLSCEHHWVRYRISQSSHISKVIVIRIKEDLRLLPSKCAVIIIGALRSYICGRP